MPRRRSRGIQSEPPGIPYLGDRCDPHGSQRSPKQGRPGGSLWIPLERGLGDQDLHDKTRRRGPTLTDLFGHSPDSRRTYPPGLCPGATFATVEYGVPLMRPKWVHHPWAHQEDGQGKESRQAGGPPHLPHGYRTSTTSTTTTEGPGDLSGHIQPSEHAEDPEPERPAGGQACCRVFPPFSYEDKLASQAGSS